MSTDGSRFYRGASRAEYLDALCGHASQGSTAVLEGDAGSGVSCLLGQAVMALFEGMEIIRIDAAESHDGGVVVEALLRHFDIERPQLADVLRDTLANSRLTVVVDNAEELLDEALMTMGSLKQKLGGRLAYLFGGLPGAAEKIKGADLLVDDVLDLPALSVEEVTAFADQVAGVTLSEEDAVSVHEESHGLPGILLELLQDMPSAPLVMAPGERQEGAVSMAAARALPWRHVAAVAGLLVLLVIIWSAFGGGQEGDSAPVSRQLALPVPKQDATQADPEEITPLKPTMKPVARLEDLNKPGRREDGGADAGGEPVDAAQRDRADSDVQVTAVTDPIMQSAPAEKAASSSTRSASESRKSDTAEPVYHQASWLKGLADSRWFLQVMVTGDEAKARAVLDQIKRHGAYYSALRNGKSVFLVLAGDYASRQAAEDARASLPERLRAAGPFPRQMAAIRKEL
ncbi:MAG: SPOR domain-containing protein [Alcanivorax sp.]|nr:SPOR domain-containing protein [Alcanivorax sp.]